MRDHSQLELGGQSREGEVRKVAGELSLLRGLNDEHIVHDRCILVLCVRAEEPEESCVVDDMSKHLELRSGQDYVCYPRRPRNPGPRLIKSMYSSTDPYSLGKSGGRGGGSTDLGAGDIARDSIVKLFASSPHVPLNPV